MIKTAYTPAQIWLLAARPKTLPAAIAPVLIGVVMAHEIGAFDLRTALAALLGAILIQIGTNFANDYFDFKKGADEGERLGPLRVTQAGLVSPAAMKRATTVAFLLAMLCGTYLVWCAGWPIVIIGVLAILFGLMYTGGPYPLGYNGLGEIFVLIFFGPVAVAGTFYVQTMTVNESVVLAGLAPGLMSVAILSVNNLRDIDGDRLVGKRTLAARFGRRFARLEYALAVITAAAIPALLFVRHDNHPWAMLTVLVIPLAIPTIGKVYFSSGRDLNPALTATGQLLMTYSLLFAIGWLL
jgi:1,4-dihydroxy-2-naphthoate octaprenyltransferase